MINQHQSNYTVIVHCYKSDINGHQLFFKTVFPNAFEYATPLPTVTQCV